eukprot:SAG11_NODE_9397_length_916_cov_1.063647_1_plen_91_part_00
MDASKTVDARVELLLAAMTNEEKQAQTVHLTGCSFPEVLKTYGASGLGACPGQGHATAASIASQNANQVRATAPPPPRREGPPLRRERRG